MGESRADDPAWQTTTSKIFVFTPGTPAAGECALTRAGQAIVTERGLPFQEAKTGEYVSGTLIGSTQLASGRYAMIDNGLGFSLVPWQPVLDKRIGQHITGIVHDGGGIEWSLGRKRGLGL